VNPPVSAVLWVLLYLLLVAAPLLVLLIGPVPPGAGFWWDFSMALGFAGMAMMGVQFALTARFSRASAPFGIDIIYYFHRYVALIALGLLLAHFVILRIEYAEALGALDPRRAPWYMTAGRVALALFAVVIITSLWRKPLRIEYDRWRLWHALLATVAFLAAVGHIAGVGYYTAAPWKRVLWTAYTLFWVLLIVYVRLAKPWAMRRRPWRVAEVRAERGNAWTLALAPEGHAGLAFAPGQFAWLTLRASPYQVKEHPFSFSSSAEDSARIEFTIKELGDFTRTVKTVQAGEVAYLNGPYGVFSIDRHPHAPGFVFIAGGVGIAPIMSMLRSAADRGERRPLTLVYANNRWDDVIFREELEQLRERLDLKLVHVLAEPPEDWVGERGYVDDALLARYLPPERRTFECFLCGPRPMTDAAQRALTALGVPLRRVHFELFEMV
jgi:predicted ferric reductase